MSILTFNASWQPDGVPTNATSATIGLFDATTQTQVVTAGTAMPHVGTGAYAYTYTATEGHTYIATMTVTGANGAQGVSQQVVTVPISMTIESTADDGSTDYISRVYARQRGMWTNVKLAAMSAIAAMLPANEPQVSYSISGRLGSESTDFNGFFSAMTALADKATQQEIALTEQLQFNSPFDIRQHVGVRSRWQG